MPKVAGKKFSYTTRGMAQAKSMAKTMGKPMNMMSEMSMKKTAIKKTGRKK